MSLLVVKNTGGIFLMMAGLTPPGGVSGGWFASALGGAGFTGLNFESL
jgi:hypothetical protein